MRWYWGEIEYYAFCGWRVDIVINVVMVIIITYKEST